MPEIDEWTKYEIGKRYMEMVEEKEDKEYAIHVLHQDYELPEKTIKNILIEEKIIEVKNKDYSPKK
jgi:lipopolysaccharide biosynthesis glycosyltransferase